MRLLTKIKIKNSVLAVVVSITAIFVPSLIFNKWIEGVVFFICHWLIREQFPKQYHRSTHAMCRVLTSTIFFFGVSFILPLCWSLFSAVPICYFISWVGLTKKQADYYELKYKLIIEKYCNDKEDLLVKCRNANLSQRDTEIAVKYFYEKQTPKEIWLWLCEHKVYEPIEWDSVYHLLWVINKKLNKN